MVSIVLYFLDTNNVRFLSDILYNVNMDNIENQIQIYPSDIHIKNEYE
jgi:hypothetical protein